MRLEPLSSNMCQLSSVHITPMLSLLGLCVDVSVSLYPTILRESFDYLTADVLPAPPKTGHVRLQNSRIHRPHRGSVFSTPFKFLPPPFHPNSKRPVSRPFLQRPPTSQPRLALFELHCTLPLQDPRYASAVSDFGAFQCHRHRYQIQDVQYPNSPRLFDHPTASYDPHHDFWAKSPPFWGDSSLVRSRFYGQRHRQQFMVYCQVVIPRAWLCLCVFSCKSVVSPQASLLLLMIWWYPQQW